MSAPDPFALGGRADAELIEAERKIRDLNAQSNALLAIATPDKMIVDTRSKEISSDDQPVR